jgi:hypothetical protein
MAPRTRRLSASQVGQYAFCAHAWWLAAVEGLEPDDLTPLEQGTHAHERHGWQVSISRGIRRLALVLMGLAGLALALWALFQAP